jgi:A/G-specific adenine glycosylase
MNSTSRPDPDPARVVPKLLAWFRANARDLPWRRTRDPYRIWLSEIMLQQTRVETVLDYYERFTRAFPRVEDLARADDAKVLKHWEGLGYYGRARNLLAAARSVVRESGGRFPDTAEEWLGLPGVGRYTAGAIASIAYGERTPVLDGNVKRVLARLHHIRESIDDAATVDRMWALAGELVSARAPGDSNQALMELGARVCRPRNPRCGDCPVRAHCRARAAGEVASVPVRRAKKTVPHHEIVAAAIRKNGRFLFGRRPLEGLLGGLWEFPGGKVEAGETHAQALAREIREELGVAIEAGALLAVVRHAYSHFRITLHLYEGAVKSGRPAPGYHTELKWLLPSQFDRYAFPAATLKLFPALAARDQ